MAQVSFSIPPTVSFGELQSVFQRIGIANVTFNFPPSESAPRELLSSLAAEKGKEEASAEKVEVEEVSLEVSTEEVEPEVKKPSEEEEISALLEGFHFPPAPPLSEAPLLVRWELQHEVQQERLRQEESLKQQEYDRRNQEYLQQQERLRLHWASLNQNLPPEEGFGPMEIETLETLE